MNTLVANIQEKTDELTALCQTHKQLQARHGELPAVADSEVNRLWSLAQDQYKEAASIAIQAAIMLSETTA